MEIIQDYELQGRMIEDAYLRADFESIEFDFGLVKISGSMWMSQEAFRAGARPLDHWESRLRVEDLQEAMAGGLPTGILLSKMSPPQGLARISDQEVEFLPIEMEAK